MDQQFKRRHWRTLVVLTSALLAGCSTVSDIASSSSSAITKLNPFSGDKQENAQAATPATSVTPAAQPDATAIRVENQPESTVQLAAAAPAASTAPVQATVGDNEKCTTFCALPLRHKPQ